MFICLHVSDAEPKYLVAVQPIPSNDMKKHCTGISLSLSLSTNVVLQIVSVCVCVCRQGEPGEAPPLGGGLSEPHGGDAVLGRHTEDPLQGGRHHGPLS